MRGSRLVAVGLLHRSYDVKRKTIVDGDDDALLFCHPAGAVFYHFDGTEKILSPRYWPAS